MRTLILIGLTLAAIGCQRPRAGHFSDGGFYQVRSHYRIRYAATGEDLLPAQWRLTNYAHDDDGHPTEVRPEVHGVDLLNSGWLGGRGRSVGIEVPKVDLHFRDADRNAEIWVRTMLIPGAWQHANLASVLHTAVAAISDGSVPLDPLGRRFSASGATVRDYGDARIDGRVAHWVEFDVTRGQVQQRVTLVGVWPAEHRWQWRGRRRFPMMLVFGFSSSAEEHESVRREFAGLVRRVDIAP